MNASVVSRILQIILSVASIKLSTTVLAPDQLGRFALVNSISAFYVFLLINPVGMFLNRHAHAWWESGAWPLYMRRFTGYCLAVAVAAALSFVLAAGWFESLRLSKAWMFALIFGLLAVSTLSQVLVSMLNLLGFVSPFAVLTVATPLLGLIASLALCHWLGGRAEIWFSGLLLGQALSAVAAAYVFRAKALRSAPVEAPRPVVSRATIGPVFHYAWPIAVAVVLAWMQNQGYRLGLEKNVGLESLGLFVAGFGVALGVMSAMESILGSYLYPAFYRQLAARSGLPPAVAWNEYAAVAIPVLVLTAATLAAVSAEAARVLLAPAYWQTGSFVAWGACIELLRTAGNVYGLALHAEMDTRRLIWPNLVGAVASITLLYALSSVWGLSAAGPALALAGVLYIAVFHAIVSRVRAIRFPWRAIAVAAACGVVTELVLAGLRGLWPVGASMLRALAILAVSGLLYAAALKCTLHGPVRRTAAAD